MKRASFQCIGTMEIFDLNTDHQHLSKLFAFSPCLLGSALQDETGGLYQLDFTQAYHRSLFRMLAKAGCFCMLWCYRKNLIDVTEGKMMLGFWVQQWYSLGWNTPFIWNSGMGKFRGIQFPAREKCTPGCYRNWRSSLCQAARFLAKKSVSLGVAQIWSTNSVGVGGVVVGGAAAAVVVAVVSSEPISGNRRSLASSICHW